MPSKKEINSSPKISQQGGSSPQEKNEKHTLELISRYRSYNDILESYLRNLNLNLTISKYCLLDKPLSPLFENNLKFFIIDIDLLDKTQWSFINKMERIVNIENILFMVPSHIEGQVLKNQLGSKINVVSKHESGDTLKEYFYVFFGIKDFVNWDESLPNKPLNMSENNSGKKLLSKREREIAQLIRSGMSSKEMVEFLHLSDSTISTYKKRLFDKLQVSNIVQLVELEEKELYKTD